MAEASRIVRGSLHPVMPPRVQLIRYQISQDELESRLSRLGLSLDQSFSDNEAC